MGLRVNSRFEIKVSAIEKKNLYANYIAKESDLYETIAYCIAAQLLENSQLTLMEEWRG